MNLKQSIFNKFCLAVRRYTNQAVATTGSRQYLGGASLTRYCTRSFFFDHGLPTNLHPSAR